MTMPLSSYGLPSRSCQSNRILSLFGTAPCTFVPGNISHNCRNHVWMLCLLLEKLSLLSVLKPLLACKTTCRPVSHLVNCAKTEWTYIKDIGQLMVVNWLPVF